MTELSGPAGGKGMGDDGAATGRGPVALGVEPADGKAVEREPDKAAPADEPDEKNSSGGGAAASPFKKATAGRAVRDSKEPVALNADKAATDPKTDRLDPDRPSDQERLIYRPIEPVTQRSRHRYPVVRADHFKLLRNRLEEVVARDESDAVVVLGLRHESGLPNELLASLDLGQVYIRGDLSGWGSLKRSSFDDLLRCFVEAAGDRQGEIVFVDRIPFSERSGDIERLADGAYDDRMEEFEARLKERGFRFFLIVTIDRPVGAALFLNASPGMRWLPWTDLWLSGFAQAQTLPVSALFVSVGDTLQRTAEWHGYEDDDRERMLSIALQELGRKSYGSLGSAVAAVRKAAELAKDEVADEVALSEKCRKELGKYLGSSTGVDSVDPVKQVMLAVAAFAGGTNVGEYYAVCRELMPDGPAEILRLPPVAQERVMREAQNAERMNREHHPLPGWDVVFDHECDTSRSKLGIIVREGQAIELDSRWKIIDLKREIAHEYPGLINSFIQRIREKRLFLILSEAESGLLVNVICAIRDACQEGFDDWGLAAALTGAQRGLSDFGTPLDIVATLFPGHKPEQVLELVENIDRHRHLAQSLSALGKPDPELEQYLLAMRELYPEVTPENFFAKFDYLRSRLREESVRRLTRHVLRMRISSSAASEKSRPIVTSMLDILESLLSSETYVAMLTYMIATTTGVDVVDIGRRLQREFTRSDSEAKGEIILAIQYRLKQALDFATAPHGNWLLAFDPIRAGKSSDDRLRALGVFVWDMVINYDVLWRVVPYQNMKHLRVTPRLFGERPGDADPGADINAVADLGEGDEALLDPLVNGFLARDPGDWLTALGNIDEESRFELVQNVKNRIEDVVWIIMTGAAEADCVALREKSHAIAGDLLTSLTGSLLLGAERDFHSAAQRVVDAKASPTSLFNRKWLSLYGLFWPAMLAHWRFTAFGLEPFEAGSEADRRFRALLERLVEAAPQRAKMFRDGFQVLAKAADKCAAKLDTMRASASADLYRLKSERLSGLAAFFARYTHDDLPVVV